MMGRAFSVIVGAVGVMLAACGTDTRSTPGDTAGARQPRAEAAADCGALPNAADLGAAAPHRS